MDIKNTLNEFRKGLDKLVKINTQTLLKIQDQEPEKVSEILKDQKKILRAVKENDFKEEVCRLFKLTKLFRICLGPSGPS